MLRQSIILENRKEYSNAAFTIVSCIVTTPRRWLAVAPGLVVAPRVTVHTLHRPPCMTRLHSLDLAPIEYSGRAMCLGDPTSIALASSSCPSRRDIELALT